MNNSNKVLVFTEKEGLDERIKEALQQVGIFRFERVKKGNENVQSQIEKIESADICFFVIERDKQDISQEHEGFMCFSIDEIEEDLLISYEREVVFLRYDSQADTLTLLKKEKIGRLDGKKREKNENDPDEANMKDRLLLRILYMIESYVGAGSYEAAITFCKEGIKYMKDNKEETSMRDLEDRLACLYWEEERESSEKYRDVLRIYQGIINNVKEPSKWLRGIIRCRNNAAYIYKLLNKYTQAELNYKKAREYADKFESDEKIKLIDLSMAGVLRILGNYDQAEEVYKRQDRQDELKTMYGLSLVYLEQEEYLKAKESFSRVYEKLKTHFGKSHPKTIACKEKLSFTHYALQEYKEAKENYEEILEIREKEVPRNIEEEIQTMYYLALVYTKLKELEKIRGISEKILMLLSTQSKKYDREQDIDGKDKVYNQLEEIEEIIKNKREGDAFFNKLLKAIDRYRTEEELAKIGELLKRVLEDIDSREKYVRYMNKLEVRGALARLYRVQKDFENAEKQYEELVELLERSHGSSSSEAERYRNYLIRLYQAQGKLDEAEEVAKRRLQEQEKIESSESWKVIDAKIDLVYIYMMHGKEKEAEELYDTIYNSLDPVDYLVSRLDERNQKYHLLTIELYKFQKKYQELQQIYERQVNQDKEENGSRWINKSAP